jgi:SAM-dependent methyltransferase
MLLRTVTIYREYMPPLSMRVLNVLRCPECYDPLTFTAARVACGNGHVYPVVNGAPVLIPYSKSVFDADAIAASTSAPTQRRGFRRILPSLSWNRAAEPNFVRLRNKLLHSSDSPLVLNIGGGDGGVGYRSLTHPSLEMLLTDVALGPGTQIAADAHCLPFEDESFDGVVVQAVLEHVLDPWACVNEIFRVLRLGGYVYAETPFMQQVHMGRYDFTRFTTLGHRRLFRRFEEVASGAAVGPGSALAWTLTYFVSSFARSPAWRRWLDAVGRLCFFGFRYFDRFLTGDSAMDAACGLYFLGRKVSETLSDRELIAQYRGGMTL